MAWRVRTTMVTATRFDVRPFLRWVGGKFKSINLFARYLPSDVNDRVYVEPFLGCYDDSTEILTEDGFVFFKNLNRDVRVASLVGDDLEFVLPEAYQSFKYDGDMYEIKSKGVDLLVTPNHNIFYKESRKMDYQLEEAQKIKYRNLNFKGNVNWNGDFKEYFYLPVLKKQTETGFPRYRSLECFSIEKIKMDDWLEFFGYFISEGFTTKSKLFSLRDKRYFFSYRVGITQSPTMHLEKYEKIKSCLDRLPFAYHEHEHHFIINNKQLYEYLARFGKSFDKFIPKEIKSLNKSQLKILFDALMLGDGYNSNKGIIYYTISPKLVDDMSEIMLKIGYTPIKRTRNPRKSLLRGKIIRSTNIQYEIYARITKTIKVDRKNTFLTRKYKGAVYCVTVPSHIIYVRRNGKSCWCGNSGAMFFFKQPDHAVISDSNPHLINAYQAIKSELKGFLYELGKLAERDSASTFLEARTRFNAFKDDARRFDKVSNDYKTIDAEQAAIFVYLIGRCFNGLYRENAAGEYNVSYAKDLKGVKELKDVKNFTGISRLLNEKNVSVLRSDYKNIKWRVDEARASAGRKCFYFLDPVYYPAKPTGFTKYNKMGWDETEFSLLRVFVKKIDESGDKFMLCNHDVPRIRELFKNYRIERHVVPRCVSCDTKHRDPVTEVVIMNYRNASLSDYIGPPAAKGSNVRPADP